MLMDLCFRAVARVFKSGALPRARGRWSSEEVTAEKSARAERGGVWGEKLQFHDPQWGGKTTKESRGGKKISVGGRELIKQC